MRDFGWATAQFLLLQNRADAAVTSYQANRSSYLRQLPLVTPVARLEDQRAGASSFPVEGGCDCGLVRYRLES